MKKKTFCNDRRCFGEINFDKKIRVPVCQNSLIDIAHPCSVCGLLHSEERANFFEKDSNKMLYFKEEKTLLL